MYTSIMAVGIWVFNSTDRFVNKTFINIYKILHYLKRKKINFIAFNVHTNQLTNTNDVCMK